MDMDRRAADLKEPTFWKFRKTLPKYQLMANANSIQLLTLIYMGGGQICPPGSFFATAQKRLELDCWNFVAFIVSLLHIIWYTFWSPGT